MVENKKIKLPPPLQLDSVSPATRLLEKRRLMYEVQKAFEDQKKEFEKEEKRCRVREKELREKDILIQDNLIRFSSFLSQQDTRKTKDNEAAQLELAKNKEKDKEIANADMKLKALSEQYERIERKVQKLRKFETFLREMQSRYQDEFTDLQEIITRYLRQSDTNRLLTERHAQSGGEMDTLIDAMEKYKKVAGVQTLSYTNRIADEQRQLQNIEAKKAKLMNKNKEVTERRLKETSEHGIILMSIKSLWQKIALKNNQNNHEIHFIQHKTLPQQREEEKASMGHGGQVPTFSQNDCLQQLDVIQAYVDGFNKFLLEYLNQQIDTDVKTGNQKKQTYYQRMVQNLQNNPAVENEIEDFMQFDPSGTANR